MCLSRLIYISESQLDPAEGSIVGQLAVMMRASVRNNQAAGITGALVFDDAWFLQVLEGERRAIWQTFQRISEDERHSDCLLIQMVEIDQRQFGNWWMGLATRDAETATTFAPFLHAGMLRPQSMNACDILKLMKGLAKRGLRREMLDAA